MLAPETAIPPGIGNDIHRRQKDKVGGLILLAIAAAWYSEPLSSKELGQKEFTQREFAVFQIIEHETGITGGQLVTDLEHE